MEKGNHNSSSQSEVPRFFGKQILDCLVNTIVQRLIQHSSHKPIQEEVQNKKKQGSYRFKVIKRNLLGNYRGQIKKL